MAKAIGVPVERVLTVYQQPHSLTIKDLDGLSINLTLIITASITLD